MGDKTDGYCSKDRAGRIAGKRKSGKDWEGKGRLKNGRFSDGIAYMKFKKEILGVFNATNLCLRILFSYALDLLFWGCTR
ncbi:hypothetical protein [Neisseria perflava]|uniref:hypothetical protein n=1 Tax=Neisseria perflava TaxID=33053 RepID=UPI00209CC6F6|nr:hypothetical protein [Neisseria perflava]